MTRTRSVVEAHARAADVCDTLSSIQAASIGDAMLPLGADTLAKLAEARAACIALSALLQRDAIANPGGPR